MNQILYNCNSDNKLNIKSVNTIKDGYFKFVANRKPQKGNYNKSNNHNSDKRSKNIKNNNFNPKHSFINFNKNSDKIYKTIFFSSVILLIVFIILLLIRLYENDRNEEISQKLTSSYSISTLYSDYSSNSNNYSVSSYNESSPFVIGIIKIDKINLNYSILSISNNDLLDISVCRFAGPMPNEIGNLCIAGHNYVDYKFFSRINELEINDEITIYDLSGNNKVYEIYDIYETKSNDMSCTFQDTNGLRIITLITCNNMNGKRLVIHAKEIP